ncbi:hypothetical protein D3C74_155120 [compost metagenome]
MPAGVLNVRIFHLSVWIALLTVFVFPGKIPREGAARAEFGFPFTFLTEYRLRPSDSEWFIHNLSINLLSYFLNVMIIYAILHGLWLLKRKWTEGTRGTDHEC